MEDIRDLERQANEMEAWRVEKGRHHGGLEGQHLCAANVYVLGGSQFFKSQALCEVAVMTVAGRRVSQHLLGMSVPGSFSSSF